MLRGRNRINPLVTLNLTFRLNSDALKRVRAEQQKERQKLLVSASVKRMHV